MTVLKSGDLATAMRASMSVPGAIAPVQIDGKMLVDGGLTRNLPVDVAREHGCRRHHRGEPGHAAAAARPDHVGARASRRQMLNILTEQNVQASLASLQAHGCADPAGAGRLFGRRFRQHAQHHPHRRGRGAQGGRPAEALQPAAASSMRRTARGRCACVAQDTRRCRRDPRRGPGARQRGGRDRRAWRRRQASRWTWPRSTWTCAASTAAATSSMSATS